MSKRRGTRYDAPELELEDEVSEVEPAAELAIDVVPPEPYALEIDLGTAELGAVGFFAMKRALRQIRREYFRNLGALKGRNVKITMRVSGAPNS